MIKTEVFTSQREIILIGTLKVTNIDFFYTEECPIVALGSRLIANTHMCLLYDISIVFNSVPLSLDLTVEGPGP